MPARDEPATRGAPGPEGIDNGKARPEADAVLLMPSGIAHGEPNGTQWSRPGIVPARDEPASRGVPEAFRGEPIRTSVRIGEPHCPQLEPARRVDPGP